MTAARFIALVVCSVLACIAMVGCGSAQMTTMKAEFALGSAVSLCYRTVDGVDEVVTDKIRVTMLNGDHDAAVQAYADYKPKIEKARLACRTANDAYENADAERQAAAKINDWKQFNQWLPVLIQSAATVQQAIADIKGLVQ